MRLVILLTLAALTGGVPMLSRSHADTLPRLFIIGDSTVRNGNGTGADGLWGWGDMIRPYFDSTRIKVENRALGGRSSRTFLTEGRWEKVLTDLKAGDFVLMQFGHNDGGPLDTGRARASLKGNGDDVKEVILEATGQKEVVHSYGWYLQKYIAEAKAKGATAIVLSPIPRNIWSGAKVARASNDYGKWAMEAAKAGGVSFVDLNEIVANVYEQIGQAKVAAEFFTAADHTHTTLIGAQTNAAAVVEGLSQLDACPLRSYLLAAANKPNGTEASAKSSSQGPKSSLQPRQMENLGRGLVAIHEGGGKVYVSWRLLGTDPEEIGFNLYRATGDKAAIKLNSEPLTNSTDFIDAAVDLHESNSYFVRPVPRGMEAEASAQFTLPANAPVRSYLSIPLRTPAGYTPNDGSVGDLDGDGEYEIVLHQASRGRDNSQAGRTGEPILQAYKLDGTFLWQINLGKNIREGAHYTQFMVYDLDGDGKAEVVCKTADGSVDGEGRVIGDPKADYRNASGYVLDGPEFLTVFDGLSGKALATTNYIPARGKAADWGDNYGNRVDRFLACVAYLDGVRPSVVMCRGYYTRTVLAAWNWRDAQLTRVWTFDSDDGTPGNLAYRGQGDHSLTVGDIDGDGRDEIIYGACAIDDNGKGLYSTGLGHGDALHLSDIDPDRPGLEVFNIHERPRHPNGAEFRDARTGKLIWGKPGGTEPAPDVGRGVAMDIDPRHRGYEMWASGFGLRGLWNVKGEQISGQKPRSCNFGVWWDGDLLRELLDRTTISKWNWDTGTETRLLVAEDSAANNGTKATPVLCADILGDWREEVIWRSADNKELRIYTTTIPSEHRLYTLMHDPQYRLSVAWQNVGYNQPTQPGFYLGNGMGKQPRPNISVKP